MVLNRRETTQKQNLEQKKNATVDRCMKHSEVSKRICLFSTCNNRSKMQNNQVYALMLFSYFSCV